MRLPLLFLLAALLASVSTSFAQDIESGCDCWQTEPGTQISLPGIPVGFFGTKNGTPSDAIPAGVIVLVQGDPLPAPIVEANCPDAVIFRVQWFDEHGSPVSPDDIHRVRRQEQPVGVEPIDTIVCRPDPTTFAGVGNPVNVDIQLVELSLTSINPIEVTYGMEPPSLFDVFVTEDGTQFEGVLQLTPNQMNPPAGSTLLDGMPVNYLIEFRDVDQIQPDQSLGDLSLEFTGTTGSFTVGGPVVPSTNTWGVVILVALLITMAIVTIALRRRSASDPSAS